MRSQTEFTWDVKWSHKQDSCTNIFEYLLEFHHDSIDSDFVIHIKKVDVDFFKSFQPLEASQGFGLFILIFSGPAQYINISRQEHDQINVLPSHSLTSCLPFIPTSKESCVNSSVNNVSVKHVILNIFDVNLGLSVFLKASLHEIYTRICYHESWKNGQRMAPAIFSDCRIACGYLRCVLKYISQKVYKAVTI